MPRIGTASGRRILLFFSVVVFLLCSNGEAKKKAGGKGSCSNAKSAEQLVKSSRKLQKQGSLQSAFDCLQDGAETFPESASIWEELGTAAEELGHLEVAKRAFSRALDLDGMRGLAALKLGNMLATGGEDSRAIDLFQQAGRARPDSPIPYNNIGLALMRLGRLEEAQRVFLQGLDSTAEEAFGRGMLLTNLGVLYRQTGKDEEALGVLEDASGMLESVESVINLAQTLIKNGDFAQAEARLESAMQKGMESSAVAQTYAVALAAQGRVLEAARVITKQGGGGGKMLVDAMAQLGEAQSGPEAVDLLAAIGVMDVEAMRAAAQLLAATHQHLDALRAYTAVVRMQTDARTLSELGMLLYRLTRFSDAENCFRRISQLKHADKYSLVEAYNGLGAAIEMSHTRLNDALHFYKQAFTLMPSYQTPFFSFVHLLGRVCDWREWDQHFATVRSLIDEGGGVGIGPIFALAYPLEEEQLCHVAEKRAEAIMQATRPLMADFIRWQPQFDVSPGRIVLAVISADFNFRPVGQIIQNMFALMDKERFEVICFSSEVSDGSQVLVNIHNSVEEFHWVKGLDVRTIAEMINSVQAHTLLDLNGYTDGGQTGVGILKPAEVAINYLGYPYTLALPQYDYVLTDRVVTPPEHAYRCFQEAFAVLPRMYMVNAHQYSQSQVLEARLSEAEAAEYSLPHHNNKVVFANFNHLQKVGPGTFALWMATLAAVHDSILWLLRFPGEAEAHLKAAAQRAGIDPSRLLFTDKFPSERHLTLKQAASVLLDSLEYNGHVSGLDALWVGLPMVTLPGDNMARRCGASSLLDQDLSPMIARTQEEYVAISQRLGQRPAVLQRQRAKVEQQRLDGPLFDTAGWVRSFERMLQVMWEVRASKGDGEHPKMHIVLAA